MSQNWRDHANCRGTALALFFHPEGERDPERSRREARAKAFCRGCPVRSECLQEALADNNSYGTWGGMSERERRQVIAARKRSKPNPNLLEASRAS